ncbi:hypothetical protein HA402_003372 [Bradysia odoriphaga]|nr:hypothetical protein HA402_003372 [Bradysia odoriphaga]
MKIYFMFAVLFAGAYLDSAYVIPPGKPSTHRDFPNQCYVPQDQTGYAVGEHTSIGGCRQINCYSNFAFGVFGCGTVGAPPGYHNEIDLSKPYPDCCINFVKDDP